MSPPVTPLTLGLAEAAQPFPETALALRAAYPARKAAASNQVTPPQLIEAMTQCLTITTNLDKEEGELGPIVKEDLTQLGEYGLSLVADLTAWAVQLTRPQVRAAREKLALATADWSVRHESRIHPLEPLVNALASSANMPKDPQTRHRLH